MYKSNINLNLYKDFYAVCEYGSLANASKYTYTSAPALSKSIKNLERELNCKLFDRKKDGMELTRHGKELLYYVEKSFNNLLIAERNMIETEKLEKGMISIGMPSNVGSFYLFDKIRAFHDDYPNIDITIVTGSTTSLIDMLDTHKIDFVIDTSPINLESKDLYIKELDEVSHVFITSTNSNYKDITSIKELSDKPLILPIRGTSNRKLLDDIFDKYKLKDLNILNLHTSEMILSFVKKNAGIGYIIKDLVVEDKDIKILDIKEELPKVKINLVYNNKYLTNAPAYFIKHYITEDLTNS